MKPNITFDLYCFTYGAYAAAARVKMQSQEEPKLRPNISLAAETTRRVVAINNLKYSSGVRGGQKSSSSSVQRLKIATVNSLQNRIINLGQLGVFCKSQLIVI
jgi:hypothetical protein